MRSDHQRLLDIQEAIERVERHTRAGRPAFDADEVLQVYVVPRVIGGQGLALHLA